MAAAIKRAHGPHPRTAEPCALCLAAAQPRARQPRDTRFAPIVDALLPWLLALGLIVPLTLAVDGALRMFVAGVGCGVLVGGGFAWRLHGRDRATGLAATARVRAEIGAESDARANAMLVQFEWAVHDIAVLRSKLDDADAQVREHAQHAFAAERDVRRLERNARLRDRRAAVRTVKEAAASARETAAPLEPAVIGLRCDLHDAGPLAWLDLSTDDANNLPSRVRVFSRDGNVVCVSDPAVHGASRDGKAHSASLKMPLPPELASAVRRGELDGYRFEALVSHNWVGVKLLRPAAVARAEPRRRIYPQMSKEA